MDRRDVMYPFLANPPRDDDALVPIILLVSAYSVVATGAVNCLAGWLDNWSWETIAISTVISATSLTFAGIMWDLRRNYGPDWREGRRRFLIWHKAENRRWRERWEERKRVKQLLWDAPEIWMEEEERLSNAPLPVNPEWSPPSGMMWDGSADGDDSEHTAELRRRWPEWFKRHRA